SVIGIRKFRGPITLLSRGISNIVGVMQKLGVKRILTITGAGILQETSDYLIMDSLSFPPNLLNISQDHLRMYMCLRDSGLDWTIVSPSFMHSGKRTQQYLVEPDYFPKGALNQVSVEDVADFMVREMTDSQFLKKRVGIAHPK
ncbi:MAG: NAD(P)H-binding protein, partial [Bacteroidota bacterium]